MRLVTLFLSFMLVSGVTTVSNAADGDPRFSPSADLMGEHALMLEAAKSAEKRLMIIIGANWCHDTTAFLKKLDKKKTAPLVEQGFVTWLVDVGNYNNTQWEQLVDHYGLPTLYGTPTPIVVDPATDKVLNPVSLNDWRNAYKEKASDIRAWVEAAMAPGFAELQEWRTLDDKQSLDLLERIDAFERRQGKRIRAAFKTMSDLLDKPEGVDLKALEKNWYSLADMRSDLLADTRRWRQMVVDGRIEELATAMSSLPEYKLFDGL